MQYLYIIKCQEFYKIGIASDIKNRQIQLSTGNPFPLDVIATYEYKNAALIESVLHKKHISKKIRGEWFVFSDQDIEMIKEDCVYMQSHTPIIQKEAKTKPSNEKSLLLVIETVLNMFLHNLLKNNQGTIGKASGADYYEIRLPTSRWEHDGRVFRLVDGVGNLEDGK